ncbi:transposase-like protein [Pseudomonas aeruginosa]|nr:transposase [Pseudomonas aeruginosa]MCP1571209.1 transposase-like protein [Pseudomonas aeruginosa]TEK87474.1 transposase [Pseudomonas aeruginosa]
MSKQRLRFPPSSNERLPPWYWTKATAISTPAVRWGGSALRRWVKQLEAERQGVTPKSKALTPEQQKIQELEARINRLEREKAILKKATALLMSDELDRTR